MPIGKCAVCLETKELQDSHFISKALYRIARKRGGAVVKTPQLFLGTDAQVRDRLLCRDCEQLFSKNGEDYVMRLVKQDAGVFPLLEMLSKQTPIATGPNNGDVFSAPEVGIDVGKIAYYGLSMFWRAAVHVWTSLKGQTISSNLAQDHLEAIRRYLHGEVGWPAEIVLQVTVCTDSISQDTVQAPTDWENDKYKGASMVVFGIFFMLVSGVTPGDREWIKCCMTAPKYAIFRHSCASTTGMLEDDLRSNARIADNLRRKG